jgi:hypothetical protein
VCCSAIGVYFVDYHVVKVGVMEDIIKWVVGLVAEAYDFRFVFVGVIGRSGPEHRSCQKLMSNVGFCLHYRIFNLDMDLFIPEFVW